MILTKKLRRSTAFLMLISTCAFLVLAALTVSNHRLRQNNKTVLSVAGVISSAPQPIRITKLKEHNEAPLVLTRPPIELLDSKDEEEFHAMGEGDALVLDENEIRGKSQVETSIMTMPSTNYILDVFYYELHDPFFGLVDTDFEEAEISALLNEVNDIWLHASRSQLSLRIHRRKVDLDHDRALAYLLYVVGHPRIAPAKLEVSTWLFKMMMPRIIVLEPYLMALGANGQLLRVLENALTDQSAFAENGPRKLFKQEFESIVGSNLSPAFEGLVADPKREFITLESFKDFLMNKDRPEFGRRLYVAFKLFYLDAGMSTTKLIYFSEIVREHPLVFLHYAIGRDKDLSLHQVNRTRWEFANTISLFPVPYYHDLNGRASPNWMDIVFRSSSCGKFSRRRFLKSSIRLLDENMQCRWGVRKWEQHELRTHELARTVAHEMGHVRRSI
jgi:hypothetical protein